MSDSIAVDHSDTDDKIRHSKEDALNEREFELLLEGASQLKAPYDREAKFAILVMGRMGFRLGELTHIRNSWIDWRNRRITIPRTQSCRKGSKRDSCSLCHQQATQYASDRDGVAVDDVLHNWWRAKTDAAARSVSFSHDPRLEIAVERHFEEFDHWPYSHSAIRRRVKRSAEEAREIAREDVYPHCLRATLASRLASGDCRALKLKGIMGWETLQTSESYVAQSPETLDRAMQQAFSR